MKSYPPTLILNLFLILDPDHIPNPRSSSSPLSPFHQHELKFGIISTLTEDSTTKFLRRKPSSPSFSYTPSLSLPNTDPTRYPRSTSTMHSLNVPLAAGSHKNKKRVVGEEEEEDEDE